MKSSQNPACWHCRAWRGRCHGRSRSSVRSRWQACIGPFQLPGLARTKAGLYRAAAATTALPISGTAMGSWRNRPGKQAMPVLGTLPTDAALAPTGRRLRMYRRAAPGGEAASRFPIPAAPPDLLTHSCSWRCIRSQWIAACARSPPGLCQGWRWVPAATTTVVVIGKIACSVRSRLDPKVPLPGYDLAGRAGIGTAGTHHYSLRIGMRPGSRPGRIQGTASQITS